MEPLKAYATKEGWQNDWRKTQRSVAQRAIGLSESLDRHVLSPVAEMDTGKAAAAAVALAPVGAVVLAYVGAGAGWLCGEIIDRLPYVRDVAPFIAQKTSLIHAGQTGNFNTDFYQTVGAVTGFWQGMTLPLKTFVNAHRRTY